ncbi:DUF2218 domain-containing protein [Vibrio japonicus]|uniref:DUF2218 domain-containing protein n=1 Tax=Vibrio japonicus TaxID=1824638 RepID=A0ABY5LPG6_9VIBR|nr:DUF2218 domain-containing protein [Vibrio japonicus]UUM32835.1 DUF2218 domain-containing protein [Vibrio japonicus]
MEKYTVIQSEHVSKYLVVLCRHFARKVESTWDDEKGEVHFPVGKAYMATDVTKNTLTIRCVAENEQKVNGVIAVIDSHVHMFSRRETLQLTWHSA